MRYKLQTAIDSDLPMVSVGRLDRRPVPTTPLSSPTRHSTRSAATASSPPWEARPAPSLLPQPRVGTFVAETHARCAALSRTLAETPAEHDDRVSPSGGNHSPESFLRIQDGGETDQDDRVCSSPQSFIDLGRDEAEFGHSATVASSSQEGEQRTTTLRSRYLSIDSTLLFNGLRAPASPGLTSDASRDSTLSAKLEDFPAPPSLGSPSTKSVAEGCFDEFGSPILPRKSGHAWGPTCPSVLVEEAPVEEGDGAAGMPSTRSAAAKNATACSESAWFGSSSDSDAVL